MKDLAGEFMQSLLSLDRLSTRRILADANNRMSPLKLIDEVVVEALERIGAGWENGTIALSQVYMSGRICEELVDTLLPPESPDRKDQPKMAVSVLSDHHMLGKIIVYSLLRASGFDLLDYGRMEVDDLIHRVKEDGVEILLLSVLMLPSALQVKELKEKLIKSNFDVKIIVGGAPFRFDDQLWREVGADAMCQTAPEVVTVINEVVRGVS